MSHTPIFVDYYERGFWANQDGSSGPNSAAHLTPLLRQRLSTLLEKMNIQSILDAGCGDANLIRHMSLNNIHYTGLDCVPKMIQKNQADFCNQPTMRFQVSDILTDALPQVDLILCRDVVHYLPNPLIQELLSNFIRSGSTYLLITHNLFSPSSANTPTELGIFRPVNLCQQPFCYPEPLHMLLEDEYGKSLGLWDLRKLA
jgi:SAM-dependent methyltransferase